ncbi:MAG: SsrA-binding protein SmpB [Candidatus Omnitrophica bacterium]|nr:SsrA-binding protein SmpB [Candidatus Omnitrophota bacterium]MDD5351956.1 SsrA-binding protein SmpB [Candidatus Omnitrophota bacterium]MDD5550782.1 SsrA-binding protein SmpB [Candidatus Omnitrophota bacterium]
MTDTTIATNSKAFRDYSILETVEAGIELKGSEVKSLREKRVSLNDSFARAEANGIILYNCHITNYDKRDGFDKSEPTRPRRLLLHKQEINKLSGKVNQRGFSLIPLKMYFNRRGFAKVELALAKGKKLYDKRRDIKERQLKRELRRAVRRKT